MITPPPYAALNEIKRLAKAWAEQEQTDEIETTHQIWAGEEILAIFDKHFLPGRPFALEE